ncbi:hypothetical protein RJ639_036139 [Escallonia herrerae]|uniref:Uncharacterized protein n=1 Tax=Escallonia herrerae TaxID=1293975 RepID=A0AA88WT40_9ASTE|nr:hypothetical protein RJ639_036139 [Escallonia herrerae]
MKYRSHSGDPPPMPLLPMDYIPGSQIHNPEVNKDNHPNGANDAPSNEERPKSGHVKPYGSYYEHILLALKPGIPGRPSNSAYGSPNCTVAFKT